VLLEGAIIEGLAQIGIETYWKSLGRTGSRTST